MSQTSGFFENFGGIGDAFETLAGVYLEHERIKSGNVSGAAAQDQAELIGTPSSIDQNVNAHPASPEQIENGLASGESVNVFGTPVNKTVLMVTGAVLGVIFLAKVMK
ncbi:hypothetical protein [Alkalimarinus coralli]|uniref:hypothetical protein n=1 Tax=Alkalimarinus coralli TaxID=2935863 RepID=UPI00202B0580|nr:hypothetical protein [Alkalimarinus coralli]